MTDNLFGKYEILKKVGMGGMAEVLLARQIGIEGFEKLIVIKRVLPHLADSAELIQMLLDEARLAARLNHPNIVQIYDLGRVQGQYFIAMEYVNGVDLSRILKKEKKRDSTMPVSHGVKILSYVCEALSYAHNKTDTRGNLLGLVHRDISPHNVLVSFEGGIKLTDFGIAKASSHLVKTKAGTLKGKYSYVSPEQCLGHGIDQRSDIFAAGILLYEITTGTLPFSANSEVEALHNIVYQPHRPPTVARDDYPVGLIPILEKALAKDPDKRYPDALAFQMDLENFLLEEKIVSNITLIGQYVRDLFSKMVAAQAKESPDGKSATVAGILSALEAAHGTPSDTASLPQPPPDVSIHEQETRLFTPTPSSAAKIQQIEPEVDGPDTELTPTPRGAGILKNPVMLLTLIVSVFVGALIIYLLSGDEQEETDTPDQSMSPAAVVPASPKADPLTTEDAGQKEDPKTSESFGIDLSEDKPEKPEKKIAKVQPEKPKTPPVTRRVKDKKPVKKVAKKPQEGFLTLNTEPWSEVWFGETKLGLTPLAYKKLPAGRHKLVLRNPAQKIKQTIWVRIRPGKTTSLMVDLEKK